MGNGRLSNRISDNCAKSLAIFLFIEQALVRVIVVLHPSVLVNCVFHARKGFVEVFKELCIQFGPSIVVGFEIVFHSLAVSS